MTRITVGLPLSTYEKEVPFQLTELKRIAQAVVHFEDALQMLVPKDPEQRRNWQDNNSLKSSPRSRAIAAIEKAGNHKKLSALLCPASDGNYLLLIWDAPTVSSDPDEDQTPRRPRPRPGIPHRFGRGTSKECRSPRHTQVGGTILLWTV